MANQASSVFSTRGLARMSSRNAKKVIGVWIIVLVGAIMLTAAASVPDAPSK